MNNTFTLAILFAIISLGGIGEVKAAENDSLQVRFRQSHIELDPRFSRNGERIDSMIDRLRQGGGRKTLRNVRVRGAASPEGSVAFNKYLSERRADAILKYFRKRESVADSLVSYTFVGRDWEGLKHAVAADENVPYRDDVMAFLEEVTLQPDKVVHPLARLKALHSGVPYNYMYRNIFPSLRTSTLVVEYDIDRLGVPSDDDDALIPLVADLPLAPDSLNLQMFYTAEGQKCRPFYMAAKTNMLYDAALIPNIGVEFYVGKGWSLTADWMYGWWDKNSTHYYWRAYGGSVGVRRWFGRRAASKPLTGHHLGLYAGVVTYDFELGGRGYMGGLPHKTLWDRCNYVGGVEYGYSLPVARRLNIDFTIGVGYMGGKYLEYEPKDRFYVWKSTRRMNWIGPTKAEISLVWLIGCDNYNRKSVSAGKGGWQ